jgi:hypothetical protein
MIIVNFLVLGVYIKYMCLVTYLSDNPVPNVVFQFTMSKINTGHTHGWTRETDNVLHVVIP